MPASSWPDTEGSPHGSFQIQPSRPLPPRLRPAFSSEAITEKKVATEGKKMQKVRIHEIVFDENGMPGSVNWWWIPTGSSSRKAMKTSRTSPSLATRPLPACSGRNRYQET